MPFINLWAKQNCTPPANFKTVDMRADFGPQTEQDSLGNCYAHQASHMLSFYLKKERNINTANPESMVSGFATGALYTGQQGRGATDYLLALKAKQVALKDVPANITMYELQVKELQKQFKDYKCAKRGRGTDPVCKTLLGQQERFAKLIEMLKKHKLGTLDLTTIKDQDGGMGDEAFVLAINQGPICLENEVSSYDVKIPEAVAAFLESYTPSSKPSDKCQKAIKKMQVPLKDQMDWKKAIDEYYSYRGLIRYLTDKDVDLNNLEGPDKADKVDYILDMLKGNQQQKRKKLGQLLQIRDTISACKIRPIKPDKLFENLFKYANKKTDQNLCKAVSSLHDMFKIFKGDIDAVLRHMSGASEDPLLSLMGKKCVSVATNKQVKAPKIIEMPLHKNQPENIKKLNAFLDNSKPVAIDYTPAIYQRRVAKTEAALSMILGGGHGSTIIGKVYDCKTNKLHYIVRNSWGVDACHIFRKDFKDIDYISAKSSIRKQHSHCIKNCKPTSSSCKSQCKQNRLGALSSLKKYPTPYTCDKDGNFIVEANHLISGVTRGWSYE
ncbi:MAG: hypothetical protein ISR65_07560 [Bacteriovoracaceae bacterium]|nr:hypothetical protein [Bacteriovoracaceae bacterium]